MRRRSVAWIITLPLLLVVVWCGVALVRLHRARADLAIHMENLQTVDGFAVSTFFSCASLRTWKSFSPLLRNPLRDDIRLYFVGHPRTHAQGDDAHAVYVDGRWDVKVFH